MIILLVLLFSLPCFAGESSQQPSNLKSLFETHKEMAPHLLDDQENQNNYRQTLIERSARLSEEFFGENDHAALKMHYPTINNTYLFACLGNYESLKDLTEVLTGLINNKNYTNLSPAKERFERLQVLIKERALRAPARHHIAQPSNDPEMDDFVFFEDESAFENGVDEEFQPTVLAPKEIDKKGKKRARDGQ